ncbi:MAG: threonine synthase [Firmicutes bacterium]|nr:threonine synthase [Bacillota bacterium]
MNYVSSAVCMVCGHEMPPAADLTLCPRCGGLLDIRYDYRRARQRFCRGLLAARKDPTMWRYRELLPVAADFAPPPLRVGGTPLYDCPRLGAALGLKRLWIKDEGVNPTASMKDRASAMAAVKAVEGGYSQIACASTGNAASSLAGAAASMGLRSYIFVPQRAPMGKIAQLLIFGARVMRVQGDYQDAFRLSAQAIDHWGWYNRNAAVNPYMLEGKKTVAMEIAEQLQWQTPDWVAVSVGDGCTIAGVWKGFHDLYECGLIQRLPRLLSVQAAGCCPINAAFAKGGPLVPQEENTLADSIAVGHPRNPDKALQAIAASQGAAVNVTDEEILAAMRLLGRLAGVFAEPAGAAALAGLSKAVQAGILPPEATAVHIVTGNGLKDVSNGIKAAGEPMDVPPDLEDLKKRLQA